MQTMTSLTGVNVIQVSAFLFHSLNLLNKEADLCVPVPVLPKYADIAVGPGGKTLTGVLSSHPLQVPGNRNHVHPCSGRCLRHHCLYFQPPDDLVPDRPVGTKKVSSYFWGFEIFGELTLGRMILAGLSGIILVEIYAAVMQREFQNTDNRVGKGFAVLGIYLFVVVYCKLHLSKHTGVRKPMPIPFERRLTFYADGMLNSTTWLYGAEILPIALRSKVMGLAAASHFIVNVGSKWKYCTTDYDGTHAGR